MKEKKEIFRNKNKTKLTIILITIIVISSYFLLDLKKNSLRLFNPLSDEMIFKILIKDKGLKLLKEYAENYTIKKDRPIKNWVNAQVEYKGVYYKSKLKLHGSSSKHYWNARNRNSFSIKLQPDSCTINGRNRFKLIIDEECNPAILAINNIANSMGLIAAKGNLKYLKINDKNMGVYAFVEDIKKELLHREHNINNFSIIANSADWTRKEFKSTGVRHRSDFDLYHGHIEAQESKSHPLAVGYYKLMNEYIQTNNIEALKKMFDVEYIGKYLGLAAIFNDVHFMTGDNLKYIYDFDLNKIYPIYRAETSGLKIPENKRHLISEFNSFLFSSSDNESKVYSNSPNLKLFKLLLSDNEIRNIRDMFLQNIILNLDDFLSKIENDYLRNKTVMIHSDISKEKFDSIAKMQIYNIKKNLSTAENYISYGHVYGSFNLSDTTLNLITDAFCPVKITSKNSSIDEYIINGIEFDAQLNMKYQYIDIPIKSKTWKKNDLIFINLVSKDTIKPQHIHINNILEIEGGIGSQPE